MPICCFINVVLLLIFSNADFNPNPKRAPSFIRVGLGLPLETRISVWGQGYGSRLELTLMVRVIALGLGLAFRFRVSHAKSDHGIRMKDYYGICQKFLVRRMFYAANFKKKIRV